MNDNQIKRIISKNIQEFSDSNTLCYSIFDFYKCKGDMIELKYKFDIIESTLWVCEKCFSHMVNKNEEIIL